MFCINCGKQIGDKDAFCPYCGAKTKDGQSEIKVQEMSECEEIRTATDISALPNVADLKVRWNELGKKNKIIYVSGMIFVVFLIAFLIFRNPVQEVEVPINEDNLLAELETREDNPVYGRGCTYRIENINYDGLEATVLVYAEADTQNTLLIGQQEIEIKCRFDEETEKWKVESFVLIGEDKLVYDVEGIWRGKVRLTFSEETIFMQIYNYNPETETFFVDVNVVGKDFAGNGYSYKSEKAIQGKIKDGMVNREQRELLVKGDLKYHSDEGLTEDYIVESLLCFPVYQKESVYSGAFNLGHSLMTDTVEFEKIENTTGNIDKTSLMETIQEKETKEFSEEIFEYEDEESAEVSGRVYLDVTGQEIVKSAVKYVNEEGITEKYKVVVVTYGFCSEIELEVIFGQDGITIEQVSVLHQDEVAGHGAAIEDEEIISRFVGEVTPLDDFDVVSGATFTSDAVKYAINAGSAFIQAAEFGIIVDVKPTEESIVVPDPMEGVSNDAVEKTMDVVGEEIVKSAIKYVKDGVVEAFKVTVVPNGFAGPIEMEFVFAADGLTVKGVKILSQSETPAFGAKIEKDEYLAKFAGVVCPVESFDLIAGATTTSEVAKYGMNAASAFVQKTEFGIDVEVKEPDVFRIGQ